MRKLVILLGILVVLLMYCQDAQPDGDGERRNLAAVLGLTKEKSLKKHDLQEKIKEHLEEINGMFRFHYSKCLVSNVSL